jgi:hypothetical protein
VRNLDYIKSVINIDFIERPGYYSQEVKGAWHDQISSRKFMRDPSIGLQATSTSNKRRPSLDTLPPELVENVAEFLRWTSNKPPGLWNSKWNDWTSRAIQIGLRNRVDADQYLSAFSQVCSSLRGPVERILYREIYVQFAGVIKGDGGFSSMFGCVHRLLRTLQGRSDLRHHVRSVYVDWPYSYKPPEKSDCIAGKERAFLRLLTYCPSMQTLFVTHFPDKIDLERFPKTLNVTILGTSYFPAVFQNVSERFQGLRELRLYKSEIGNVSTASVFPHRLKKLRFDRASFGPSAFALDALAACGDSVEDLEISDCIDDYSLPSALLPPSRPAGANLRNLRIQHSYILDSSSSAAANALRSLPRLEQLCVSRFPPSSSIGHSAFGILPQSLRSLHLSGYIDRGVTRFFKDLGVCLQNYSHRVVRLDTYAGPLSRDGSLLLPLHEACEANDIPMIELAYDENRVCCGSPEIQIFCKRYTTCITVRH